MESIKGKDGERNPPTIEMTESKRISMNSKKVTLNISFTDEQIKKGLANTLKFGIIGELVVISMMFIISNLIYGTSWNTFPYTREYMKIGIWIPSDSTDGLIETAVQYVTNNNIRYGLNYKFDIKYSSELTIDDLKGQVNQGRLYAALAVNEGASEQLLEYLNGTSTTQPNCIYYYDQARAGPSFQFALGSLGNTIIEYTNFYITENILAEISSSSFIANPISNVVQPVLLSVINLHKVDRYGLFVVSGSGSLQMYLVMLCHTFGLAPISAGLRGHGIKRYQLVQLSAFHRLFGALYLSIFPMIIVLILGSGTARIVHSPATFFITWAFTWLVFSIYGGLLYHIVNIFGLGVSTAVSIIFVNFMQATSGTSVPLAASPLFYYLGYGFPFFNVALGFKYIWFESLPNIFSQAIGILFIWWVEMFIAVQVEVFDIVHKTNKYWRDRLHLYADEHNVLADERENSRKEERLSSKRQQIIIERKKSRDSLVSLSGKSQGYVPIHDTSKKSDIIQMLEEQTSTRESKLVDDIDHNHDHDNRSNNGEKSLDSFDLNQDETMWTTDESNKNLNIHQAIQVSNDSYKSQNISVKSRSEMSEYVCISTKDENSHSNINVNVDVNANVDVNNSNNDQTNGGENVQSAENAEKDEDIIIIDDENIDHDQTSLFDPSVRPILKEYIKKSIVFEIVLMIVFVILMFFTYGSSWDPYQYHKNISIALLNANEPTNNNDPFTIAFNKAITTESLTSAYGFRFHIMNINETSPDNLKNEVNKLHLFGAFIVNKNATVELNHYLTSTSNYIPPQPLTFIYNGARGGGYIVNYLRSWSGQMEGLINAIVSDIVINQASVSSKGISGYNIAALTLPAEMYADNIHHFPNNAQGSDGAISSACTAMYLGMIAHCVIVNKAHEPLEKLGISYERRVLLKAFHILIGSFFLAFAPSISMVWYGFSMYPAQYFQFWAMLWIGMCSFGSYIMTNYHLFGFGFGSIVNILLYALNTAANTSTLPIELLPSFFRIGYGLPAAQFVIGSRYILFGSDYEGFQRAVGVLMAWIFTVFFFSLTLIYRKRRLEQTVNVIKGASLQLGSSLRKVFRSDHIEHIPNDSDDENYVTNTNNNSNGDSNSNSNTRLERKPSEKIAKYENYELNTQFKEINQKVAIQGDEIRQISI